MKNLKKVLAMVLAFACTFTMFAGAKVFDDVKAGSDYSEAITMLSDLGVIKGKTDTTYAPEETITREEACALIARLLTGEPDVVGFENAQNFTDTKYSWAKSAIGYCVVNGIAVGDGNGKFRPTDKITDAEFVTMVVRAMGYETPDMKQNWPHAYLSAAMAKNLLDNVNMVATSDALRGENAQIIYNALFADYARGALNNNQISGTTNQVYPTLAESVWNLSKARVGNWDGKDDEKPYLDESNCEAHTWVIIGEAQDDENALLAYPIDDDKSVELYEAKDSKQKFAPYKFKYAGDPSTIEALKGYQVELYGEGSHGKPTWKNSDKKFVYSDNWTIKAIKTVKGQSVYDYNASMADKKDDNGTIELEDKSLDLGNVASKNAKNVDSDAEVIKIDTFLGKTLNGISIKDDKSVEKALNVRNGNQYKLIDWDSDGEIDWIVVDQANYYKVESASSKRVTVTSMKADKKLDSSSDSQTETWKLNENEKIGTNAAKKDVKIKYEVPEGLKEGDVVEVTYKVSYQDKSQLITATATVVDPENEKLDKVGTRNGLTLTFGDQEMKVAQNANSGNVIEPANPSKYKDFNGEELGTEFALWTDRNGFIVYSDYATESTNYMMVLNTYGGKDRTGNRELAVIDMLTAGNEEKHDVKVTSDARVLDKDGKTLSSGKIDAYDNRKFDESQVVGNVFKYWTNEDGEITKMQAVFVADDAKTDTAKEDYTYKTDADRLTDKNGRYIASLEGANALFAVKEDYIQADTTGGTQGTDIKVNASDVLATKQSDIPDISTDPKTVALLGTKLNSNSTWLGTVSNKNRFVVNTDKNGKATAAILGVENFNKFNSGATKLGLVTNVSERSGGYVEIDAAVDGEVKTLSTVEKTKFSDVVKVYDGKDDKDVSGVDSTISAAGNGIFDGKRLSNVVNDSGMYAEITTDKDGNLTKVTFLDDDTTKGDDNKLSGHYYNVSRNIVLNVSDKNLRYGINDNKNPAYFASDSELYTVGRLEAASAGYADDAKFYNIDATPSRHDEKKYDGKRLTVTAGFDNLREKDITAGEKTDIDYNDPNLNSRKNVYEISDLAFNSSDDIVAAYSFKSLDEVSADNVVFMNITSGNRIQAGAVTPVTVNVTDYKGAANTKNVTSIKVYDEKGNDATAYFTVSALGNGSFTILAKVDAPVGKYTVKAVNGTTEYAGGMELEVAKADNVSFTVNTLKFQKYTAGTGFEDSNAPVLENGNKTFAFKATGDMTSTDATPAPLALAAGSAPVTNLTAANVEVFVNGSSRAVTALDATSNPGVYKVTVSTPISEKESVKVMIKSSTGVTVDTAVAGGIEGTVGAVDDSQQEPSDDANVAEAAKKAEVHIVNASTGYFTFKLVGPNGSPVKVDESKITIPSATVKANSDGSFTATSTTGSFSGSVTVIVDGNVKTFTTAPTGVPTISASKAYYTLMNKSGDDAVADLTGAVSLTNIQDGAQISIIDAKIDTKADVTADDLELKFSDKSKKVQADVDVLNKLNPDDVITITLRAGGATLDVTATIQKAADITPSSVSFDVSNNKLVLTLDKDYASTSVGTELSAVKASDWESALKAAANNNIITEGAATVKDVSVSTNKGGKTEVTLELNPIHAKFNTSDSLTGTNVMNEVTLPSGTKVKVATNVTIEGRESLEVSAASVDTSKTKITLTLADEATATKFADDVNALTASGYFTVTTSAAEGMTSPDTSTTVSNVEAKGSTVEITLSQDLSTGSKTHYTLQLKKDTQFFKKGYLAGENGKGLQITVED